MIRYTLLRLAQAIPVLLIVATLTFLMLRLLPGGPFDRDKVLPPEIVANVEARYNLDESLGRQYLRYIAGIVRFDLGPSYKFIGRDVADIIRDTLPTSLQLGGVAFVFSLAFGIPIGLAAGVRSRTRFDRTAMLIAVLGISVPSFVLAAALILLFGLWLGWLPAGLWEGPSYVLLPALTLAALPAAYIAQLTRASVLEVIGLDYVRTARAKGVSERVIRWRHVLRNALLAVVTYLGPLLAALLTGSFVVEKIFAIPGLGRFFVTAVTNRDYPLVLGATLVYAAFVVVANVVVDLLYARLDPRISLGGERS